MAEGTGGPVPFTHPATLPPSSLPSSLPQTQPSVGWVPVTGRTGLAQRVSAFHMARVYVEMGLGYLQETDLSLETYAPLAI